MGRPLDGWTEPRFSWPVFAQHIIYWVQRGGSTGRLGTAVKQGVGDCVRQTESYIERTGIRTRSSICSTSRTTNPSAYFTPIMRP